MQGRGAAAPAAPSSAVLWRITTSTTRRNRRNRGSLDGALCQILSFNLRRWGILCGFLQQRFFRALASFLCRSQDLLDGMGRTGLTFRRLRNRRPSRHGRTARIILLPMRKRNNLSAARFFIVVIGQLT